MESKLSTWLQSKIDEKGWTNRELARRMSTSNTTVNAVLNEERSPSFEFCMKLADLFTDVTAYEILIMGKLLPTPGGELTFQQLREIVSQLSPDQRQEVLDYALWRLERQKEEDKGHAQNGNGPATASASPTT